MKKFIVLAVCCKFFTVLNVHAQKEFKPFRVDAAISATFAFADTLRGINFYIEPRYEVVPHLSVGFKIETGSFWRDKKKVLDDKKNITSYHATADYTFYQHGYRPFVGAGLGIYRIKATTARNLPLNPIAGYGVVKSNLGVMLRAGFVYRDRFTAAFEYDFAGNDALGTSANFLSLRIGFFIGGGQINPGYSP